jgi:hypothetical protein
VTGAQVQALLRELPGQGAWEQRDTGAPAGIGAVAATGSGGLAVTFTDGTRATIHVTISGEGGTS